MLPHLHGQRLPGISRGFHCVQPAPRENTAPVAGKSLQPSHEPPFQAPFITDSSAEVVKDRGVKEGGGMLESNGHEPLGTTQEMTAAKKCSNT